MSIYERYGLQRVINASGRMTILGVSTISKEVGEAMVEGASNYVVVEDLQREAGKRIAELSGAEGALVVGSASAGIAMACASLVAGDNREYIEKLHKYAGKMNRKIILPRGHNVNYGTSIEGMIALGGCQTVEAGSVNECYPYHIEALIDSDTAALMYVKSHHCVQKNHLSIEELKEIAERYNLPLIIDAAAEEDIKRYVNLGDIVIFSGAKAIEGPTSGVVLGKNEYMDDIGLQQYGIGRAMKIGKEGILGFLVAFERYMESDKEIQNRKEIEGFCGRLSLIEGVEAVVEQDEAGREIYRGCIRIEETLTGKSAVQVASELKSGDEAVFTRDYKKNQGMFHIDPRPLGTGELELIEKKIKKIIGQYKHIRRKQC